MKRIPFLCLALASCTFFQAQKQPASLDDRSDFAEKMMETLTLEQDPKVAFAYFRNTLQEDPELTSICHGLSHELGHAAYTKYGFEEAFTFEDDFCGSGYIHGIVETHLAQIENLEKVLPTICPPESRRCYHGIGHGLMYKSDNNLSYSLQQCNRLNEVFQRIQCAEGVFMENFETDTSVHHSDYLRPDDPFFPCRRQSEVNEAVCAFYAPRYYLVLHSNAFIEAIDWCMNGIPTRSTDACIKGVGSATMKVNMDRPLLAEQICLYTTKEKRKFCIEGMVSYYIVHFASVKKGEEFCPLLQKEHQAFCSKIVQESRIAYPNEE